MSQAIQPYGHPEATPVGHTGTRVEIHERPAWAINGWLGVLLAAACIAAVVLLWPTARLRCSASCQGPGRRADLDLAGHRATRPHQGGAVLR